MKVLLLSQGRKVEDQPDFDVALRNATCNGEKVALYNLPFISYVEKHGGSAFYEEVLRINGEFKPDLVFFQFFHSINPGNPRPCIKRLRESANHPLVFGSLGDPFNTGFLKYLGRPMPRHLLQLASVADAMFPTAMGPTAQELVRHGAKNVVFLPHAFNVAHFPLATIGEKTEKKYDVVMVGSFVSRFAKRILWGFARGSVRHHTVDVLVRHFGTRFALFGARWNNISARGMVPYNQQLDAMKAGRVSVDVPAHINDRYYASDRPFFIAGAGVPLVMKHVPGFDKILRPDEHVYYAQSIADIPRTCDRVLDLSSEVLESRRRQTLKLIAERHLIANRMDTLLSVYESLRAIRSGAMTVQEGLERLRLWHFLPDVDLVEERKHAVFNWVG